MPKEIYLLKVGMTMTEGTVSEWFVNDGAKVKKGEMLYALETEKVNLDVDAEFDGTVKHLVEVGVMLEPGDVVGYIFEAGETIPGVLQAPSGKGPVAVVEAQGAGKTQVAAPVVVAAGGRIKSSPAARRLAKESGIDFTALTGSGPGGRIVEADVMAASQRGSVSATEIKASPLAKRIAEQRGIDLSRVKGTGPGGRIIQGDVEKFQQPAAQPAARPEGPRAGSLIPLRGMRKTIAQRMHHSLQNSAQLTINMVATMDDAMKLRSQLMSEWEGIARPTITDLVIKATAKALQKHPSMNSQFGADGIQLLADVHVGLAVALPEGLVVPVIRHADQQDLKAIAIESNRLATAARDGKLGLDDYAGGTFTISSLGMFGVDSFTPIINEPQAGILGVNRLFDGLAFDNETPVKRRQMNLSLTFDHRVLDGAPAAEFLQTVVRFLEEPYRLLI